MKSLLAIAGLAAVAFAGLSAEDPSMGAASPPPSAARHPATLELATDLTGTLRQPIRRGSRWGVLVVSLDAGDTLFAQGAEEVLIPASNMKLFTSAAALHYLGPDYRYTTYLTATGPVRDGVLEGDLLLYGTGDPTFSNRFFDGRLDIWEALADSLAAAGIHEIAGDLVGDESHFDGPGFGRGWQSTYISHAYAAPVSALSYNENVVTIRVRPGPAVGDPPQILLVPGGSVAMEVTATTIGSGRSWVEIERDSYTSPIVVAGAVQRGHSGLWRGTPVVDPARFAVSVFAEVLEARGIVVQGGLRTIRDARDSPVGGRQVFAPSMNDGPLVQVLAVHRSPPMLDILKVVNQRSHNLYAESVLRIVGRVAFGSGSSEAGARAVAAMMEASGLTAEGLVMDDGSGLSRLDGASPRAIVDLLALMSESPHADHFIETLPEAATSRGLRRMHRSPAAGNLRAKTGTILGVSALSGYVTARNGERLAFSIIANDVPSTGAAKRIEDRIGARLAAFERPVGFVPSIPAAPRHAQPDADDGDATASSRYTIRRGDTLETIARRHGVTVSALRQANPGVQDRRLIPGRDLTVPMEG